MTTPLRHRAGAEMIGTAFLLAGVVGSGIAAERLSEDVGIQLMENALATGALLVALILALGPISGAHLNPAVSLASRLLGGLSTRELAWYVSAQVAGGAIGVGAANAMFDLPLVTISRTTREGSHLWFSELVATFGLVAVIFWLVRAGRTSAVAGAVGAYIAAAYWFTSSTSFANPAVTVTRTLSDTFAGIAPGSVLPFLVAQAAGAALATAAVRWIASEEESLAPALQVSDRLSTE